MFDHVGLSVRDFARSLKFYTEALAPLGFVAQSVDEKAKSAGFGKPDEPRLWISVGDAKAGPLHLAFSAKGSAAVKKFHAAALAAGGKDNGPPGPRPQYAETYFAAFVIDPDGNNVEAVTFEK